jgi:2-polyprenyl-6-methoxyphenol hydroxylase-like FAD-dependent oxidoreductase
VETRLLISGAGIAGLALGFWLKKAGIDPVVIDRATHFQALGHYIALKGNGVEVIRQMGLEGACRAREARFTQVMFMSADGRLLRMGSRSEFDQNLGGYILLRRSDLHQALFNAVEREFDIRYGTEIQSIRETGDKSEVEFNDGRADSFDLVVGADGIHSRTRKLVFGEGFEFPMGGQYIGLTKDYEHGLDTDFCRAYWGTGQMAALFPTSSNSLSAIFYYGANGLEPKGRDTGSIKKFLLEAYRNFAPEVGSLLSALDERAFVFMDSILQVRLPSIVKGRVALVGDAAHCPTFMSGMGSSLALQGARLLALSLQEHAGDLPRALAKYESAIAPIAARYRDSALQMRTLLLDRRPWISTARNLALRITPNWVLDRQMRKFYHAENLTRGQ